jgi:hypothetical protein
MIVDAWEDKGKKLLEEILENDCKRLFTNTSRVLKLLELNEDDEDEGR